jgi:hypothetical protein
MPERPQLPDPDGCSSCIAGCLILIPAVVKYLLVITLLTLLIRYVHSLL